jgi:hypothetical protein
LWNEIITHAWENEHNGPVCVDILCTIHHSYVALHQDTDAAPAAFFHSTEDYANILFDPSLYLPCNINSYHPASATHSPIIAPLTNSPHTISDYSLNVLLQHDVPLDSPALALPVNPQGMSIAHSVQGSVGTPIIPETSDLTRHSASRGCLTQ